MAKDEMKFPINKPYFLFIFILTAVLFLGDTSYLIFGKPSSQDLPPMISFDILYVLVAIYYIREYFILVPNNFTALELNEKEIIDHIFNVRVNWQNVSDISFKKIGYSGYISVYVTDKKEVISQTKNPFKKMNFYLNILITGTPVRIHPFFIKGKNSDIFDKMHEYYYKNGFGTHID